jgi:hypothetical protein
MDDKEAIDHFLHMIICNLHEEYEDINKRQSLKSLTRESYVIGRLYEISKKICCDTRNNTTYNNYVK